MKTIHNLLFVLLVFLGFIGCTTIRIEEGDAFDAKRSVTLELLESRKIPVEEIWFRTGDDVELRGWFLKHPEARGTVLYYGGNGYLLAISYKMLMANYNQKMNVFSFDYRGYGRSEGEPSIDGLKKDALAAYELVTGHLDIAPHDIILHGHSLGSFLALFISNEKGARAIVLESPVTDVRDWTDRLVPFLLKPFVRFEIDDELKGESNLEQIRNVKLPLLIVTGEEDKITPVGMSEDLMKSAVSTQKKLVIIRNGGHNDLPENKEYLDALADFYRMTLPD